MKDENDLNLNTNTNINSLPEKISNVNTTQIKKDLNFFSKDFLYFKNDILKELKNLEFKIETQKRFNNELKNTISIHDTKLGKLNNKLESISNVVNDKEATTKYYKEKIDILMDFKSKNEDSWASLDYKIKLNSEDIKNAINKYDKVIYDNLEYPGTIGRDSKFKDFHELIDYILNNIKIFSIFKEKNEVDLRTYKVKLDSMIKSINYQISGIIGNANSFTTTNLEKLETKCLTEIKAFDEKVMKLRVENLELIKNFENEKNKIFEEWDNIKNMKKELVELIESSIKKLNNSNNSIKKILDNYEIQFNEIKNDISSMNALYGKTKIENTEDRQDLKINSTKSDFFKSGYPFEEKSSDVKRVQSAKSILQRYIEGNTFYQDLVEQNSLRCKQHENSESSIKLMMRKYYDEGYNYIKDININKTIEEIMRKNSPLTEKNKLNKTMNSTPKANINSSKIKQKLEGTQANDNEIKNIKKHISKNRKHSANKKFILVKEEGNENNISNNYNKKNKTKSKDKDIKSVQQGKFSEFIDKSKLAKLKQLSSLSFLYDDIKTKQFPKIEKIENNKNEEVNLKSGRSEIMLKNKMDKLKFKEYSILSGMKNVNHINPKTQKVRHRINSSEIIKHHHNNINIKENEKDNSLYNINMNNEHFPEKNKKLDDKLKKKRKNSDGIKKSIFRIKSEKSK